MPLNQNFLKYFPQPQAEGPSRNFLSWVPQALGITPGMWPDWLAGSKATALTIPAAYLGARYAAAPIMSKISPKAFGETDEEKEDFAKRLGMVAGLGTGAVWGGMQFAPEWQRMTRNSDSFGEAAHNYLTRSRFTVPEGPANDERAFFKSNSYKKADGYLDSSLMSVIPVNQALVTITDDPSLNPNLKVLLMNSVLSANQNQSTGLISKKDLVDGTIETGLGAATGLILGKVFALPARTQRFLAGAGALGGLLDSIGVFN